MNIEQILHEAVMYQKTDDFIQSVPFITSETVIFSDARCSCSRQKSSYYPILSYVASFGNFEMFKALIDAGITLPLESSREQIKNKNLNQTKPFHDDSCFLVAENIINDLSIGFDEFFLPNGPCVNTQEELNKKQVKFFEDRYKMLYYAFCAGYKCNQAQFREVLRIASMIYLPSSVRECSVKIIILLMYFRLDKDSDPFFKNFSLSYNIECVLILRRKLPQRVRDMVSLYEECWDELLLFYCLEKRFNGLLF